MRGHLGPQELADLEQPKQEGPFYSELKLHLGDCADCRRAWLESQALKALAFEATLPVESKLRRKALQATRKVEVEERLSAQTSPDAARAILLQKRSGKGGPSTAPLLVALLAMVGLAGIYYATRHQAPQPNGTQLPFEFQEGAPSVAPSPVAAGLTSTATEQPTPSLGPQEKAEDTELDNEARRMLLAHLKKEAPAKPVATALPTSQPRPTSIPPTPSLALPAPADTPLPTRAPTIAPTPIPRPTPRPTQPVVEPTQPVATPPPSERVDEAVNLDPNAPDPPQATLRVTGERFAPGRGDSAKLLLSLPEAGLIEIRIFDSLGKSVKLIADGKYGPGPVEFRFAGKNEDGDVLASGTYYARVMTRWFSRVEPLEIIP